jgi:asparagine synthetase B (glutamine-hydrolysing)
MNHQPFPTLEPIEIATGLPLGARVSAVEALPVSRPGRAQIRQAMDEVVRKALLRPPCVVAFSGGRDSSAVLAVAVDVARREGLDLPVPMTLQFASPDANEDQWQSMVVRHLGIGEWSRVALTDEMELLGEVARKVVTRHGVSLYGMQHVHVPFIDAARGGAVLTGSGGDEIFRPWRWSRAALASSVIRRRDRSSAKHLSILSLPPPIRRGVLRWRRPVRMPWLSESAAADASNRVAREAATYVPTFQEAIDGYWANRNTELSRRSISAMGNAGEVQVVTPFASPEFLAAVRATLPPTGFRSRTGAMRDLFGDLLPTELTARPTKAKFNEVFWGEQTKSFVLRWDGSGVPHELVDVERLRAAWSSPQPSLHSQALLQSAWLRSASDGPR